MSSTRRFQLFGYWIYWIKWRSWTVNKRGSKPPLSAEWLCCLWQSWGRRGRILATLRPPHIKRFFHLLQLQCAALESIFPQSQTSKSFWAMLLQTPVILIWNPNIHVGQKSSRLKCTRVKFMLWLPLTRRDTSRRRFPPEARWEDWRTGWVQVVRRKAEWLWEMVRMTQTAEGGGKLQSL